MIAILENLETNEREAYFDIERIDNNVLEGRGNVIVLQGFNKDGDPRAKFIYKKAYKIVEITNDMFSIADEEMVKEIMKEKQIKIHNCL